jgi:hypothetical protein
MGSPSLIDLGTIIKPSINLLISVLNNRVMWSHHMILLDKAHQDVYKENGFFPQWSLQESYIIKYLI